MLYEIDTFGIKATLVAPGHLRIDEPTALGPKSPHGDKMNGDISGDKQRLPSYGHFLVKTPSQPYAHQNAPAGHAKRMVQWMNDNQPTSAVKSAELVWQLGHCSFPPLRLLLGSYAVESIRDRLRSIIEEIEDWKHLSFPVSEEDTKGKGKEQQDQDEDADADGEPANENGGEQGADQNLDQDDDMDYEQDG